MPLNPDDFLKNERPNEYEVRFNVRGEISVTIKADSLEEAKAKAEAMAEDEDFGLELDEASEVDISHVWKTHPMFLVMREGKQMQVSHLQEGDQPRQPDEKHGF